VTPEAEVRVKWVPEQRVVAIRRQVENQVEIQREIATLRKHVETDVSDAPIALFLGRLPEGGFDVKIALPGEGNVEIPGVRVEILPGLHVFSSLHMGPYEHDDEKRTLRATVRRMADFVGGKNLLSGDDPLRYVYHEGPETHGDDASKYVTEIQIAYHFPVWLDAIRDGVTRCAGAQAAEEVMTGSDGLGTSLDHDRIRRWVVGALDRLDKAVSDEPARACVLNACAHHYPKAQLEAMRATYEDIGDLRTFVERLGEDKSLFPSRIWLDESGDPVVYIEKLIPPWQKDAYDAADDPVMKRYHACFCPIAREAIRAREPMSPSFCYCSAGWFVQMWEAILDRKLRVDIVTAVLRGDDRCVFAIHLPEDLV
jgi:effector-binding domain-containing protein